MTADKIEMDVSREEALKSALLNIFYTETIGHCHVDEAVEHLALLPSRTVGPVLSQVRLIAHSVSDLLAFTLIENAQKALRHLSLKQLGDWVREALEIYESSGLQAAKEFLGDPASTALPFGSATSAVTLEEFAPRIRLLASGITGLPLDIRTSDRPYTDTSALFLPRSLAVMDDREGNLLLYRAMAVVGCAQIRYATFLLPLDRARQVSGYAGMEFGIQWLLGLGHGQEDAVLSLLTLVDLVRLEAALGRELPGLMGDIRRLKERLSPSCQIRAGESFLSALAAWIMADYRAPHPLLRPWMEDLARLREEDATSWDSGRLVSRLLDRYGIHQAPHPAYLPVPSAARLLTGLRGGREARERRLIELVALRALEHARGRDRGLLQESGMPAKGFEGNSAIGLMIPGNVSEDSTIRSAVEHVLFAAEGLKEQELKTLLRQVEEDHGSVPERIVSSAVGRASGAWGRWGKGAPDEGGGTSGQRSFLYDEWDFRRGAYRKQWCHLKEKEVEGKAGDFVAQVLHRHRGQIMLLRRQFEMLRPSRSMLRRQPEGSEIDIDGFVEAQADLAATGELPEGVFINQFRRNRDIAVIFLVDMSASTEGWINYSIKEALILLCEAIEALGDPYAIYGFSGMRRTNCHFLRIKSMDEPYGTDVKARIGAINARDYTRMGPAVRHTTHLFDSVSSKLKIMLILSDGKPEDYDEYRGGYAIEDTRKAIIEAKARGINPFCITIDRERRDYLPKLFGRGGYVFVKDVSRLYVRVPEIYRRLTS